MMLSHEFDSPRKTFSLVFSTTQLAGKKINAKKAKLQIELVDSDTHKLLARSRTFTLETLIKNLGSRESLRKIQGVSIRFNNMATDALSRFLYKLTIYSEQYALH
jgi:hypothetical protein